jgi:hypothetical protein
MGKPEVILYLYLIGLSNHPPRFHIRRPGPDWISTYKRPCRLEGFGTTPNRLCVKCP